MGETQSVLVDVEAGVMVITINRPDAKNAIDAATAHALADAVDRLDADPDVNVGVLTGAGGTFCAGFDLKAFLRGETAKVGERGFAGLAQASPRKPLIAAVEGWALAGGWELVLSCDLVVAAEDARFGLPEVKRGLVAAGGGLIRLAYRIPYHVAMELALTGDVLDALRAVELGLVNELVASGQAKDRAIALASRIARNGPLAVEASKRIIQHAVGRTEAEAFDHQRGVVAPIFTSDDAREGAAAFREKRDPVWQRR